MKQMITCDIGYIIRHLVPEEQVIQVILPC